MPNSLSLKLLSARADLYRDIRAYFETQDVLEVEVPVLASSATTDPQLSSFEVRGSIGQHYLQTSPEYFLKRLLCSVSQSVFTITKAFRDEEQGRRHNPEFSMLEWYRLDFDLDKIISDTLALVLFCLREADDPEVSIEIPAETLAEILAETPAKIAELPVVYETYQSLFRKHLDIDPHRVELDELQALVSARTSYEEVCVSIDEALQLLLALVIEPSFGPGITILADFPASQAALAEIETSDSGHKIAKRFELYIGQVEIANGYQELRDAEELANRFAQDNQMRLAAGRPEIKPDDQFLQAMQQGLPRCAGVSIGLDRLLMAKLKETHIDSVLLFPWRSA